MVVQFVKLLEIKAVLLRSYFLRKQKTKALKQMVRSMASG